MAYTVEPFLCCPERALCVLDLVDVLSLSRARGQTLPVSAINFIPRLDGWIIGTRLKHDLGHRIVMKPANCVGERARSLEWIVLNVCLAQVAWCQPSCQAGMRVTIRPHRLLAVEVV